MTQRPKAKNGEIARDSFHMRQPSRDRFTYGRHDPVLMSQAAKLSGLKAVLHRAGKRLGDRSRGFVLVIQRRIETAIPFWLLLFGIAAAVRVGSAAGPSRTANDHVQLFMFYGLIALAPIAGYRIAMAAFPSNLLPEPTGIRLAFYGRWRRLDPLAARAHPAFGPFGFMASLLLGMLLNVPVRSFEFLLAVPAVSQHGPAWATTIFHMMAFDVIAMNFLYAACFVAALRSIPLFPRMLLLAWSMDLLLQVAIAYRVSDAPHLPAPIAAALGELLSGNVTKVLISMAIWIPYLLLSERVNVTYRSRVAAD
ncbi:DUF2569 family protein [Sphingopyxis sp. YR583]|uniref:DUF2569 family protein n=1 Tax=Sphingopyxis sp. YR583 TaxID=1881047 RepID=UPI0015A6CE25|nr:DUF2569 family protein [Sphingopyxis sp. YR583]